jgi:tetratricopeptide (TPR) repeat protein
MKYFASIAFVFLLLLNAKAQPTEHNFIELGIQSHEAGDYNKAIEYYQKALEINPNNEVAAYEIALSFYHLGDYRKSLETVKPIYKNTTKLHFESVMLMGGCLDMLGKAHESIKIYKKELKKKYPNNYVLLYSIGLSNYILMNHAETEKYLQKAIESNPLHTKSHLLLAYTMKEKNQRIKSILALYFYLLIDPISLESASAYELLHKNLFSNVNQNSDEGITINLNANSTNLKDEFFSQDLLLSLYVATNFKDIQTDVQKLVKVTQKLFNSFGESSSKKENFWWTFYIDFYDRMNKTDNVEAFCYHIAQAGTGTEAETWLNENTNQYKEFMLWLEKE